MLSVHIYNNMRTKSMQMPLFFKCTIHVEILAEIFEYHDLQHYEMTFSMEIQPQIIWLVAGFRFMTTFRFDCLGKSTVNSDV